MGLSLSHDPSGHRTSIHRSRNRPWRFRHRADSKGHGGLDAVPLRSPFRPRRGPRPAAGLPRILDTYAYADAAGNSILCWDHARCVNHSCEPSMLGLGAAFEIAVRDIAPGDQVTCDYGGLNLHGQLRCACGSTHCRGTIAADDVLDLWQDWDDQVARSLPLAPRRPTAAPLRRRHAALLGLGAWTGADAQPSRLSRARRRCRPQGAASRARIVCA